MKEPWNEEDVAAVLNNDVDDDVEMLNVDEAILDILDMDDVAYIDERNCTRHLNRIQ